MITGSLIAQRFFNENEVWWIVDPDNLPGRCHADEQFAAGREQLFGDKDRK